MGDGLYLRQLQLGPMDNFVYLLGAEGAKETAIIDPAWEVEQALELAARDGRTLTHALVSHHHRDHCNGLLPLLERVGVRVYAGKDDLQWLPEDARGEALPLSAGDAVEVGPLRVRAVHTPGHTPGSTCFHLEAGAATGPGAIFAGDTVFVNACGRCDLPGGDASLMFESLSRLSRLPDEVRLYPGHDYGDVPVSSIGREREKNPYFALLGSLERFVAYRMRPRG
jgi:glyoxylase-like metal-dependent hydrolase (beta-lactamase superfamily II)